MVSQDVSIRLRMAAEGVDQQVKNSQTIADNYASAARSAQQMGAPQARRAAAAGAMTTSENIEYGRARGNLGGTGASARDFANQAQGLGGLVRLYATFAANIFAVSAAFNALSQAMDTANMVRGLDMLGAAAGRSLGTLSQQLVNATDGAISLREAMSATAMASSAGMTNQQILRMGQVAKTASLALGVSMPDAMNRLSRGITKLEPELLDELGIFTKIEPAVQAYALQMGKAATQLTDFERRQAFANAVLKEGEDKFSAISDASANPFDKFLAQLKNVTTGGLNLINTVLGPIVDILSQSPAALAGGLALLVTTLVQRALPALGQIREQLAADKVMAQEKLAQKQEDAVKASQALGQLAATKALADMEANAESELKIFEQKETKLKELKKNGAAFSQKLNETLKKDIQEVTQFEVNQLKIAADARVAAAEAALKKIRGTSAKQETKREAARGEIGAAKAEQEAVTALGATVQAEAEYSKAQKQLIDQHVEKMQMSRQYQSLVKAEQKLIVEAKRSEIVANMAYNTSLLGISDAFKIMRAEMDAAGNVGGKVSLALRGIAAGIGTLISGALGAIGTIIQVVTAAIAAFGVIDSLLSNNRKETQAFSDAIDQSESSIKNATKTIELYESKNQNSIQSTVALATAFGELADSMETAVKRFEKMMAASNTWDRFWDTVKGVFGYGKADTLAETLANQLYSALDVAEKFGQRGEMETRLRQFLNVENIFDKSAIEKAIKGLDEIGRRELTGIADNFKRRFQEIGSTLDSFRSNLDKSYKSFQGFIQSLTLTDEYSKLAETFANLAVDMGRISTLSSGEQVKAFEELAKNPEKLGLFSRDFIGKFFEIKDAFIEQKQAVDTYSSAIDKNIRYLREQITTAKEFEKAREGLVTGGQITAGISPDRLLKERERLIRLRESGGSAADSYEKQIQQLEDSRKKATAELNKAYGNVTEKAADLFRQAAQENLKEAADYTARAINNSMIRAGNTVASAWATTLSGPEAVRAQARIARSEQAIKTQEAKDALKMLDAQDGLQAAIRENTAQLAINSELLKGTPESKENAAKLERGRDVERAISLIRAGKGKEEIIGMLGGELSPQSRGIRSDSDAGKVYAAAALEVQRIDLRRQKAIAKVKEEEAKGAAINIKEQLDLSAAQLQREKQILDITNAIRQARLSIYDVDKQIAGVTTLASINAKAELENNIRTSNQLAEINDINRRIADEQKAIEKTTGQVQQDHKDSLKYLKDQLLPATQGRHITEDQLAARKKILDVLNLEIDAIRKRNEVEKAQLVTQQARQEAQLEIERASFTSKAEIYNLDKQFVASQVYQMDLQKANFDAQKQQSAALLDAKAKQEEAEKRLQASGLTGLDLQNAITQEQNRQNELLNQQLQQIEIERQKRLELLEIQREQTVEQERQNYLLSQSENFADTFASAFGTAGEKLGNLSKILVQYSVDQEKGQQALATYSDKRLAAEKQIAAIEAAGDTAGPELIRQKNDALAATEKQLNKNRDTELKGIADTIGATKNLFKQHTAAYKVMAGLEKAYHIMRMVNMASQLALTIKNAAAEISTKAAVTQTSIMLQMNETLSKMPFMIGEIYGKTIGQLGIFGPPVAAALVALAFGKLGGSGGKGPSISTEDLVKVQGTGQEYDASGKLVTTGTGVYGDPTAVADSVKSSMDTLNKNFFGLLGSGNSPVVKALKSIDINTGETVKALIGEGISGFAGNTMSRFGTKVGTQSNLAWYNLGIGSTTKTEILAAGLQLKGTFDQISKVAVDGLDSLGQAASGAFIGLFEDIKTTTKDKFLWVTYNKDVDYDTKLTAATQPLVKAITGTISSVGNAIVAAADAIDGSGQRAQDILKNFDFGIRLVTTGLTAEEALQKLTGEISKKLNALTLAVAPWITEFVKNGEEYFETAARIAKGSEVVRDGLYILGETLGKFNTTVERVRVEQKLIEAAGGLEEFASAVTYFEENFLTEQEKIALKQTRLVEQLTDGNKDLAKNLGLSKQVFEQLGFGAVDSTYELKALIQSFQVTDDASAILKAELLKLAPAMYEVYSEVEKFNKSLAVENIKLASTLTPLQQSLREILTTASSELEKYRDNAVNLLSVVNNVRLKFLASIRTSFKAAYDERQKEITGTIDALKRVKESFTSLQKELLRGAQSTATPIEKFNILFSDYKQALTDIQSTDTAVADAAKQALPNLAKEVLQSASELYAGSEMYTKIFDQVSRDIEGAADFIDQQISDQQKLLNELDSKYKPILDDINTNTQTSAEKLEEAYDLWQRAFGGKTQLTATDIQTFVDALKDKNTPAVKALADLFKLTDPGTDAAQISLEAIAIDFQEFARGLVQEAKTSMTALGATSLEAIRAAAVANKPADGGDGGDGGNGGRGGDGGDGGDGGVITIGPDGKVTSTIVAGGGVAGSSGVVGGTGDAPIVTATEIATGSLDSSFADDEYGTGGELITLGVRTGGATIGEDTLRGREVDSAGAQASQALQDYEDMLTNYGMLGINTDQLESVSTLLTDESLGGALKAGNINDTSGITLGTHNYDEFGNNSSSTALTQPGSISIDDLNFDVDSLDQVGGLTIGSGTGLTHSIDTGLTQLSDQSILTSVGEIASTIANSSNVLNAAYLTAAAYQDATEYRNNQIIAAVPGIANAAIGAIDTVTSLITLGAQFASQTVPYATFWRSGGVDYGESWVEPTPFGYDKGLSGRAKGGPVTANTPYMVGEVGPELFVPSSNGTIVPNNELGFNNQEIVAKLDQLIQAVAKGAVLNVQATKENTECIEQAIVSNTNMVRTQSRVGIR